MASPVDAEWAAIRESRVTARARRRSGEVRQRADHQGWVTRDGDDGEVQRLDAVVDHAHPEFGLGVGDQGPRRDFGPASCSRHAGKRSIS
jgi:hypothetical protein